jgi:hypothetical protein
MSHTIQEGDKDECRSIAAETIRRRRHQGYPVAVLEPGTEWEVQEPEWACMVPDECGVMLLRTITKECKWCGSTFEPDTLGDEFCDDSCAESYHG